MSKRKCIQKVRGSAAARNIVAGLAGALVGLVINASYSVFLARVLEPEMLGGYTSLAGIISASSLGFTAVQVSTSREVATHAKVEESQRRASNLRRQMFGAGIALATSWILLAPFLAASLKLSRWELVSIAPTFVIASLMAVELGKVHGSGRIAVWTALNQSGHLFKLLTAAVILGIARSVIAVSTALSISLFLTLCLTYLCSRNIDTPQLQFKSQSMMVSLIGLVLYSVLINLDVVIARVVLEASDSGQYSVISLYYRTYAGILGVVGVVVFPRLASIRSGAGSINRTVRQIVVGMTVVALLFALPTAYIGSRFIVPVLGEAYRPVIAHLSVASMVAVPWTGVYVAVQCRLVENSWRLVGVLFFTLICGLPLLMAFTENIDHLLICYFIIGVLALIFLVVVPTHVEHKT